jgi:Rps23 Pro-64 3,4-dihydroxylase Tpa1-like proline 4-hydroxylase
MNLNFKYKICELKDYLSEYEMNLLSDKIKTFDVDLSEIKSNLGFLNWSKDVQEKIKYHDNIRYENIVLKQYITYDDFQFLSHINEQYNFSTHDYFNFFLTYSSETYKKRGIYEHIKNAYSNILIELFGKKIKLEYESTLAGNINIYPKNSFIKKHQDNDPDGQRLFTILFFLNDDRVESQGSLLKIFDGEEVITVVPNYKHCIILEHQNHNLIHEVTLNLVDNVRYSIYSPFTIKDYYQKLEDL